MTTAATAHRVALAVRLKLTARGMSGQDLARAVGMSTSAMQRRLAGEVDFTVTELDAVARHLGTSPAHLLAQAVAA